MNKNNHNNIIRTHHSADRSWTIHDGDVQKVLLTIPTATFDGVLTDGPSGTNLTWPRHVAG